MILLRPSSALAPDIGGGRSCSDSSTDHNSKTSNRLYGGQAQYTVMDDYAGALAALRGPEAGAAQSSAPLEPWENPRHDEDAARGPAGEAKYICMGQNNHAPTDGIGRGIPLAVPRVRERCDAVLGHGSPSGDLCTRVRKNRAA
jgi:hypothetical protein